MKKINAVVFIAGIVLGVAATIFVMTWRMDASANSVSAAEKNSSKVILENDKVRVKEAIFMPGEKHPGMHTHEYAHVGVVIDGGTLLFNYPDGKTETLDLKRGGAGFRGPNVTHEAVNMSKSPIRVIEVEVK